MRHDNLIIVYSTPLPGQAEALRDLLRADGIPCVLGGILRARAPGIPVLDIQVQVPATFAAAARELIGSQGMASSPSLFVPPPVAHSGSGSAVLDPPVPTTVTVGKRHALLTPGLGASERRRGATSRTGSEA